MSKNLKQWKNTLTSEQISQGMNAATANSFRLLKDAEALFEIGSYPTAYSIAVLAIEEDGKMSILRQLAVARDGKEVKEAWKAYRSHTKKNVMWLFPSLVQSGHRTLESFEELFSKDSEHSMMLDDLKQIGFYTDCLGDRNWSIPNDVIDKRAAEGILKVASALCRERTYSKKEVDLWVKHMKPVCDSSMSLVREALNNWFSEMLAEGLIEEGSMRFSEFVGEND
ncbi:AbiV family abortive infection protein [Moritella sp. 28]|uniref:AbiV family abortive infection protein n=1 Tax=Moritella sp. 28 TaxID=2746232 RepID=UPI001BAA1E43|nr:AbiV family abortive infection protein [Moritella sp. 28]QUM84590.1 AbiV family abortive infection protein [Moritella sp. 28]